MAHLAHQWALSNQLKVLGEKYSASKDEGMPAPGCLQICHSINLHRYLACPPTLQILNSKPPPVSRLIKIHLFNHIHIHTCSLTLCSLCRKYILIEIAPHILYIGIYLHAYVFYPMHR